MKYDFAEKKSSMKNALIKTLNFYWELMYHQDHYPTNLFPFIDMLILDIFSNFSFLQPNTIHKITFG